MSTEVEGRFRRNESLDRALRKAMRQAEVGLFERMITSIRVRRASDEARAMIEKDITKIVMAYASENGIPIPTESVEGGIFVGSWIDIISLLLEMLPEILAAIQAILDMFN